AGASYVTGIIEADFSHPSQDCAGKNVLAELPVENGRDKRNGVPELREIGEGARLGDDRIVVARPSALATVDAAVLEDLRLALPHPDRLRRTDPKAGHPTDASLRHNPNGMKVIPHAKAERL